MTMTSGVGTPFFMAPEMATGTKHYTGAVDVYSFAIMAAQVMVGRLVYDGQNDFDTSYGLCFPNCLSHNTKPKSHTHCVCLLCVFTLPLVCCDGLPKHTHSVCECSVPRTSTSCVWVFSRHENTDGSVLGCQPLFSSLFVFFSPLLFHVLTFSLSCPFFHSCLLFPIHTPAYDAIVATLSALH